MDPLEEHFLGITRRQFFSKTAKGLVSGLGVVALGSLGMRAEDLLGFRDVPHFAPKAKRVIYLHMMGAPS